MATLNFFLDRRHKPKKDGTYPLKLSVTHNRKVKYVLLDLFLHEEEWNIKDQLVTSDHKQYRTINSWLEDQYNLAKAVITDMKLRVDSARFQVADYADAINAKMHAKEPHKETFCERFMKFASLKKDSTRKLYESTLDKIKAFKKNAERLYFEDITKDWLTEFDSFLAKNADPNKKNSRNYCNIHLRNIRAVFNNAIDDEITSFYPFRTFKIKAAETEKRSLDVKQLRELFNYPVEEYQREYLDMFKLMFFLCGINSADLFHLKELKDGRAVFNRAKTGKLYSIKVEPVAMEIIERWRGKNYLLDVCDRYKDHLEFVRHMDHELKKIGKVERKGRGGKKTITPLFPELSTYWARHTWATLAAEIDIPDATISRGLGHMPENKTTEIYIRRNRKKVDNANRKLIDWVLYNEK